MILSDDDPTTSKFRDDASPGRTVRALELLPRFCRPASPSLPDYETSEAQHNPRHRLRFKRVADARFWRATCVALVMYVVLTVVIGLPFLVIRSRRRRSWLSAVKHIPSWGQSQKIVLPFAHDLGTNTCHPWQKLQNDGELFSASLEQSFAPESSFIFRSNMSSNTQTSGAISGTLTLAVNPSQSAEDAIFYMRVQSSSVKLREAVHACIKNDPILGSGVDIYVPDSLGPGDVLNFTLSLLLPSSSSPILPRAAIPPSRKPSFAPLTDFSRQPIQIPELVSQLPQFVHHFGDLTPVLFKSVFIESANAAIFMEVLQASKAHVQTRLAEISGTFTVSDTLTLDTIGAPINANITLSRSASSRSRKPTVLSLDTGQSPINAHITLQTPKCSSSLCHLSLPDAWVPRFLIHMKTFGASLKATVVSDNVGGNDADKMLALHAQTSMGIGEVSILGKGTAQGGGTTQRWYQGMFDVETKLAHVQVVKTPSLNDSVGEMSTVEVEYDHQSADRLVGWAGSGIRRKGGSNVYLENSLGDAVLRFG